MGFAGAPAYNLAECDEIWQAMIWSEKRFPKGPYLTESYHSQLPATFVASGGVVNGLIGGSEFLPFMPLPTEKNSQFGMLARNPEGLAQSSIYAPVLGGFGSKMKRGDTHHFRAYVYVAKGTIHDAYEEGARNIYGFSDIRKNATVNLNTTFENMVDFCMSRFAEYNDELRGSNYSTDVPGAVKNISGLHPLSIAAVTDNVEIYKKRARPMLEYGITRERFLFATDPKIKRDGTSANLNAGPGVPLSDLSTTYTYSGNRNKYYLDVAKRAYEQKVNRSLNLDAMLYGDRWQNAMYLYRATSDQRFLDEAIAKGEAYLKERVLTEQADFSDPHSRGMFFWTSYANQFMELYLMYKTSGDERFLDAAHDGARHYARYCWMSPRIPNGQVTVNIGGKVPRYRNHKKFIEMRIPEETVDAWRVSEHGLTPESSPTCNGHRGIFMAHHAPFMMQIAADTEDRFLHDVARNAVIGRYECFPGYHINKGRTTAFEKRDFAWRSFLELNGHTSMHFNHPWSHAAMLMDYLMAEAYYYSGRKIRMHAEYAEGYAYCRSFVYGAKSGQFYEDDNVIPYMPSGLLDIDDIQLNYIAGRGNGKLYVALTNQSNEAIETKIRFDLDKAGLQADCNYGCQVWKDGHRASQDAIVSNGVVEVFVSPKGMTALAVVGADPITQFQGSFYSRGTPWTKDFSTVDFHDDQSFILNMGRGLVSAYFMTAANNEVFQDVTVKFRFDGGPWQSASRTGYPYEFTVEVPDEVGRIEYAFVGRKPGVEEVTSPTGVLLK